MLGNRGFEFISQICDQNSGIAAPDLKEFVDTFLALRGDSLLQRKLNHDKKLEKRKLHVWFLFMVANTAIVEQFYEEDSSLRDLFRTDFITSALYRLLKTAASHTIFV
jgi:hypothetical protein